MTYFLKMQELFSIFLCDRFYTIVENFSVIFPNICAPKTEQIEKTGVLKTEQFPLDFLSCLWYSIDIKGGAF